MENNNNSNDTNFSKPAEVKPRRSSTLRNIALFFLVIGLLLAGFGFANGGGGSIFVDGSGIHFQSAKDQAERFILNRASLDAFESIDIDVSLAAIEMIESDNYGLDIDVAGKDSVQWENKNGKLTVKNDTKVGLNIMNFNFDSPESFIRVYYPKDADFDSVKLETLTGGITGTIKNASTIELNSTTGSIACRIENCDFVKADCSVGGITLSSGEGGPIKAELVSLTDGIEIVGGEWVDMKANSGTGAITINARELLGKSDLDCTTDGVDVYLDNDPGYGYDLHTTTGSITVNGDTYDGDAKHETSAENMIKIRSGTGDINLNTN